MLKKFLTSLFIWFGRHYKSLLLILILFIIIITGNHIFKTYANSYIKSLIINDSLGLIAYKETPGEPLLITYHKVFQHIFFLTFNFPLFVVIVLIITFKLTQRYFNKRTILFYSFLAIIISLVRNYTITTHYDLLTNVLNGVATTPEQYRLVIPSLTYLIKFIFYGLSWRMASRLLNFTFILATPFIFHLYLKKWFNDMQSTLIVLIFLLILPYSFWHDYPSDFSEITLFIIGFIFIREKKDKMFYPLMFLASLHRETSIFLIVAYFISNIKKDNFIKTSLKSVSYLGVWLIPQVGLRLLFGIKPFRGGTLGWGFLIHNIRFILISRYILYIPLIFLPFIISYFIFRKNVKDRFLERNLITIALFFLVSLFTTRIEEIRKFTPFLPIVIPLGIMGLVNGLKNKSIEDSTTRFHK